MKDQSALSTKPTPEQIAYANLLSWGAWLGILMMFITYIIYITGVLPPHVDISLVTQNWDKGVEEFLHITQSPHGWSWVAIMHRGDFLNFAGIVLLATLTIICYLFLIAGFKKRKDWAYFYIAVAEVVVLAVAASGLLGSGGH